MPPGPEDGARCRRALRPAPLGSSRHPRSTTGRRSRRLRRSRARPPPTSRSSSIAAPTSRASRPAPDADGRARRRVTMCSQRSTKISLGGPSAPCRTSRTTCSTACAASAGRSTPAKVLPAADEQLARWAHVLQPAVDRAYAAGCRLEPARPRQARRRPCRRRCHRARHHGRAPLRDRLEDVAGLDRRPDARRRRDRDRAEPSGRGTASGGAQDLDDVLGDALAVAYSRGVYDARPPGRACAGCRRGWASVPTATTTRSSPRPRATASRPARQHRPAHPGCRCLLVVEPEA